MTVGLGRILAFACILGTASPVVGCGSPKASRFTESEVLTALHQLTDAQLRHDWAALDRLYSDDYTLTEGDGAVFTKAQRIAELRQMEVSFPADSIVYDDIRVRFYGTTAVMTSRVAAWLRKEPRGPFYFQVTEVWVKRASGWQIAASHESDLPGKGN